MTKKFVNKNIFLCNFKLEIKLLLNDGIGLEKRKL